jgi:hypothetical protein
MHRALFAGVAAVAVLITANAAATGLPHIVSASSSDRQLVVSAEFGHLTPYTVSVAVKPATTGGALVRANVVYSARFRRTTPAVGTATWRSPVKLKRRTYWVQVSGIDTGGVIDCPPKQSDCMTLHSNVVRVRIRG